MRNRKQGKADTQEGEEKEQGPSRDRNLGFPLFGLAVRVNEPTGEVLVCAGGGGGAGRTGVGNGFSLYRFRAEGGADPVFHLWHAYDSGESSINHLQLHPREDSMACGTGNMCSTYSWAAGEMNEGKTVQTDFADNTEESEQKVVVFNNDGSIMLTGGVDGKVRLWKWPELELVKEFTAHTGEIYAAHFNPANDAQFATASSGGDNSCKIWRLVKEEQTEDDGDDKDESEEKEGDSQASEKRKTKQLTEGISCVLTIPAPGGQTGMRLRGCKFSPDGKYLFAATAKPKSSSFLHKWDLSSKRVQPVKTVTAHSRRSGGCTSFNISADGNYIACGSSEGEVAIFRASSLTWIDRRMVHDFFVSKIEFAPRLPPYHVVSVSGDYTLKATKVEVTRGFASMHKNTLLFLAVLVAILAVVWMYL